MGQIKLQTKMGVASVTSAEIAKGEAVIKTRPVRYSTIAGDTLVARVAQTANVKPATVRSGIQGIKEAVRYFVMNGHHVNLGRLGFLTLHVEANAVAQAKQVSANLVKKISVGYQPSTEVKTMLENISFE